MVKTWFPLVRGGSAAVLLATGAVHAAAWARPSVASAWTGLTAPAKGPEEAAPAVALLAGVGLAAVAVLWLAASLVVCTGDAWRVGVGASAGRAGLLRPRLARLVVGVAASTLVTSIPAAAATTPSHPVGGEPVAERLTGLCVPERQPGREAPAPLGRRPGERYVVRPGDSLWGIAEARLPAGADAAAVHRAWPRILRANRDVVGADPDLIRPGAVLLLPRLAAEAAPR